MSLDEAISNLPTPERMAKGDVLTFGKAEWNPDIINDRATMPTARVRASQDRLKQLRNARVITPCQAYDCQRFRVYWTSWKHPQDCRAIDLTKERVDGGGFNDHNPERITNADRYLFIANRLTPEANSLLHAIVCYEFALDDIRGNRQIVPMRFRAAIVELQGLLDIMPN